MVHGTRYAYGIGALRGRKRATMRERWKVKRSKDTASGAAVWRVLGAQCGTDRVREVARIVGIYAEADARRIAEWHAAERTATYMVAQMRAGCGRSALAGEETR